MLREEVIREIDAWIAKAESDLKNIELVLPSPDAPLDTVCFHAQQAAEKYLKALLIAYGIPFPKIHDLVELLALLPAASNVPSRVGNLYDLTDVAVTVRYPDDFTVCDRPTTQELVEKAREVKAAVVDELRKMGYMTNRP